MPSILPRKTDQGTRFTANVRKLGQRLARTFDSEKAALKWGNAVETAIENATPDRPFDRDAWLEAKTPVPVKAKAEPAAPATTPDPEPTRTEALPEVDDTSDTPSPSWSLAKAISYYCSARDGLLARTADTQVTNQDRLARWIDAEREVITTLAKLADPTLAKAKVNKLAGHLRAAQLRQHIAGQRLDSVSGADLQAYVDHRERVQKLNASTVRNDIFCLSAVFTFMSTKPNQRGEGGRGLGIENPTKTLAIPKMGRPRKRRLQDGYETEGSEWDRIIRVLYDVPDGPEIRAYITVQVETGMRPGEVLKVRIGDVKRSRQASLIQVQPAGRTKGEEGRDVVLSDEAWEALEPMLKNARELGMKPTDRLFTLTRHALHYRWKQIRLKAGCPDLRLHDLRHEGVSRLAEVLTIGELKEQSGHKTARILMDYVNRRIPDVVEKLKKVRRA